MIRRLLRRAIDGGKRNSTVATLEAQLAGAHLRIGGLRGELEQLEATLEEHVGALARCRATSDDAFGEISDERDRLRTDLEVALESVRLVDEALDDCNVQRSALGRFGLPDRLEQLRSIFLSLHSSREQLQSVVDLPAVCSSCAADAGVVAGALTVGNRLEVVLDLLELGVGLPLLDRIDVLEEAILGYRADIRWGC